MKRRSGIKVVSQRHSWDCGVSCLSMLLAQPYGDVAAVVREVVERRKRRRRGLIIADMQDVAAHFGVLLAPIYRSKGYLDNRTGILGVIDGEMDKAGHWTVLKAGVIVDPDGAEVWSVADYMAKHKSRPATLLVMT